jgi:hypothetical protein
VDSFSIVPLQPRSGEIERRRLSCSFHAPTLRQAASLAGELRAIAASVPRIRAVIVESSPRRDWIVRFVTPLVPFTLAVLRRWEAELVEVERRFSGCRFLGWRTRPAESADAGKLPTGSAAATDDPPSQRQLVRASLLRHPSVVREDGAVRRPTLR